MELYKDFWISGHAIPAYPGSPSSTPGAVVFYQRPDNSVVQLTKLDLHNFTMEDHNLAKLFGIEIARLIVDTCADELRRQRQASERQQQHGQQTNQYRPRRWR